MSTRLGSYFSFEFQQLRLTLTCELFFGQQKLSLCTIHQKINPGTGTGWQKSKIHASKVKRLCSNLRRVSRYVLFMSPSESTLGDFSVIDRMTWNFCDEHEIWRATIQTRVNYAISTVRYFANRAVLVGIRNQHLFCLNSLKENDWYLLGPVVQSEIQNENLVF